MSRNTRNTEIVEGEVEVIESDELEETVEAALKTEKAKKEKKAPARGELPEGFVTPIGLAKILSERKLYTNRAGEVVEVKPQMVYSYDKNAPKDHPFPMVTVTDSLGNERMAVAVEDGVAWWVAKNERAAARAANAKAKAEKKAENAAKKAETAEVEGAPVEDETSAVEAE